MKFRPLPVVFLLCSFVLSALSGAEAQNLVETSSFQGVLVPRYMASGNTTRLPVIFRAKLSGLAPNTNYRYYTSLSRHTDYNTSSAGSGVPVFINDTNFSTTNTPSLSTSGSYDSLTTNGAGEYTGWFCVVSTGNSRFTPGNYVHPSIALDSAGSARGTVKQLWAMPDSVFVLGFSSASGSPNGTGIYGNSAAPRKEVVVLYDSINPVTARPLAIAYVENELLNIAGTPSYYTNNVEGVGGAWGTIIPNNLPEGVRRIERRTLANASVVLAHKDADGTWYSSVSTVNPTGGTNARHITLTDAPLVHPRISYTYGKQQQSEGSGAFEIIIGINYSGSDTTKATSAFVSSGSTAVSSVDFFYNDKLLVFPPYYNGYDTVYAVIVSDAVAENDEQFILELQNPTNNSVLDIARDTLVILNDDTPQLSFDGSGVTVTESAGSAPVKVKLANSNTNPTMVKVAIKSKGQATLIPNEFVISSNFNDTTIKFTGANVNDTISVANLVVDDAVIDASDTIVLVLRNPTNNAQVLADSLFTIIVKDNDKQPEISFAQASVSVSETKDTLRVRLNVTDKNASSSSVQVKLVTGSATAGSDFSFTPNPQTVTFTVSGPDSIIIKIPLINDTQYELPENFTLALVSPSNAILGSDDSLKVTIISDELPFYNIGTVTTENSVTGVADSLNVACELRGVVYGLNTQTTGIGWKMFIRDGTGGIEVSSTKTFGYVVKQGDSVRVYGKIAQSNGLIQIDRLDTILIVDSNKFIRSPRQVTNLDESTESDLVRILRVRNASAATTWPVNNNIKLVNKNGDTVVVRILSATGLSGKPIPTGSFHITGMGSQSDSSSPYQESYFIIPMRLSHIEPVPTVYFAQTTLNNLESDDSSSFITFNISNIPSEDVDFKLVVTANSTAIFGQDYLYLTRTFGFGAGVGVPFDVKVNLLDDNIKDSIKILQLAIRNISPNGDIGTDSLVTISIVSNGPESVKYIYNDADLKVYPNPARDELNISLSTPPESVEIYDIIGTQLVNLSNPDKLKTMSIDVKNLSKGIYVIKVSSGTKQITRKIVIE